MTHLYNFELVRETYIPEIASRARLFRYTRNGAELLSLENDEENKVFGITFRTPPADSTGIAHILEHSVLCGSRKYPLKEPFVELIKGSLKTFLNAFTYPDKTCYPVASLNTKDFYHLIDVYLDAVFYPRLTRAIFQQEGWHYELDDQQEPMQFKGVVYNEMKGAYSSPERLLGEYARQSLFPDTTYGVSSGGDPRNIPDLTYEQLVQFHKTCYHPSNARIFFYGDDDPTERLRILDTYLKDFEYMECDLSVALQPAFDAPRRVEEVYAVAPDSSGPRKSMVTLNWLLTDIADPQRNLAFHLLGYILVGMLASPLRRALIESGLGEDLAGSGMSGGLRQIYFSTGLKGIDPDNVSAIEDLIFQTLAALVRDGIDPDTIEAAVNTFEFYLRENNTGSSPRGLSVMIRSLSIWLHGGDPLAPLAFEAPLDTIKERIGAGEHYFEGLISRYLLDNPHYTTLTLRPDPHFGQRLADDERERLDKARAAMSDEEVQQVVETTHALKKMQETPDSPEELATIPRLHLSDLDRENKLIPLQVFDLYLHEQAPVKEPLFAEDSSTSPGILYHDISTSGIVYLDLGFNLRALPQELLPYVILFGRALREMGTEQEDYTRLSQRIGRKTGGIRAQPVSMAVRDRDEGIAWLFVRSKATLPQAGDLLDILRDMLLTMQLDNQERFRHIVLEAKAREEASIVPGGAGFVNIRMRSHLNKPDWANEQIGGITYLFFLRKLAREIDEDWGE